MLDLSPTVSPIYTRWRSSRTGLAGLVRPGPTGFVRYSETSIGEFIFLLSMRLKLLLPPEEGIGGRHTTQSRKISSIAVGHVCLLGLDCTQLFPEKNRRKISRAVDATTNNMRTAYKGECCNSGVNWHVRQPLRVGQCRRGFWCGCHICEFGGRLL